MHSLSVCLFCKNRVDIPHIRLDVHCLHVILMGTYSVASVQLSRFQSDMTNQLPTQVLPEATHAGNPHLILGLVLAGSFSSIFSNSGGPPSPYSISALVHRRSHIQTVMHYLPVLHTYCIGDTDTPIQSRRLTVDANMQEANRQELNPLTLHSEAPTIPFSTGCWEGACECDERQSQINGTANAWWPGGPATEGLWRVCGCDGDSVATKYQPPIKYRYQHLLCE